MKAIQKTFIDGMDLLSEETQISETGYKLLVNGRQRFGSIVPNKSHEELTDLPPGKKQGGVGVGSYKIIFVAGQAFYQNEGDTAWIKIPGFSMSATPDRYWTEIVPASTFNFGRKLPSSGDINEPTVSLVNVAVSGTPAGILVQDGVSQPWIITFDETTGIFSARVTKTYADWSNSSSVADDREYVPIGSEMMYENNILFIRSADRKKVFRSVTKRPLDFMVNVDTNGNKQPSETRGGADSVSFNFDYNDITAIRKTNIPNTFLYGTSKDVRLVEIDYTNTIFGEPTFRASKPLNGGVANEDSFADILGDYAMVNRQNVTSFNAVYQLKFKGKNSIFSKQLSKILVNRVQTDPKVVEFDNYVLFNLETTLGNVIAVFDTILQRWCAIDITSVYDVLQFFQTETDDATYLYAVTKRGKLFRMYSSETSREMAILHTRSFALDESNVEHKTQSLFTVFKTGLLDGTVRAIEYVDDQEADGSLSASLVARISGVPYPVIPPVIPAEEVLVEPIAFNFTGGRRGKKLSYIITWNSDFELDEYTLVSDDHDADASRQQKARTFDESFAQ